MRGNLKAKATVGAIIDGMGSLGAAFGPLVTGFVSDYFVSCGSYNGAYASDHKICTVIGVGLFI